MKAYKGFNEDMTCRGFQYEEGKEYETDKAELCNSGFHACLIPTNCLRYYFPSKSVYHEVELDDVSAEKDIRDSKVCGKKIRIGKRLSIHDLVREHFKALTKNECLFKCRPDLNISARPGAINHSKISYSMNISDDVLSINSASGICMVNKSLNFRSINASVSYYAINIASGIYSINCAANSDSYNEATKEGSVNVSTGFDCGNVGAKDTISIGWGARNRCKGKIGAYFVLCEREEHSNALIGDPVLVKVDGEKIKEDTWYKLCGGVVVEA